MKLALRTLLKSSGFTFAAVATLALAIGASTSVFSIADSVLLEPLRYREPDRIVRLVGVTDKGEGFDVISYPDYLDAVSQSGAFLRASAFQEWNPAVTGAGDAEVLQGATVDSGFFDVLGVRPEAGRFFVADEDKPGGDTIVVLSYPLWQRKFGGQNVVGKTILLDARPMTVVGIAPRDFEEPYLLDNTKRIDVWTTNALDLAQDAAPRGSRSFSAIARLRDGMTVAQADARVRTVAGRLAAMYPESAGHSLTIVPLRLRITGRVSKPLWILFAAVLLLLLLACVNIANLLLARIERKSRDAAIRVAIGASRWDLVRQVFAETILLALAGSIGGVLLSIAFIRSIVSFGSDAIPRLAGVGVDWRVLLFVVAATFLTALLVGIIPALQLRRGHASLRVNTRGSTQGSPAARMQSALVVVQVAISITLLVGAVLVGRSLWNLLSVDKGIDEQNAVAFNLRAPRTQFLKAPEVIEFYRQLIDRLAHIPGVEAAGATTILPLGGDYTSMRFRIDGRPELPKGVKQHAELRGITPGYFGAVGQNIVAGRDLTAADDANAPFVMVIDETMAKRYWPGQSALGARVKTQGAVFEVVGIVRGARLLNLAEAPEPAMYVPHAQAQTFRTMSLVVRSEQSLATLAPAIRAVIAQTGSDSAVGELRPYRDVVAGSVASQRFRAMLLLAFGAAALLLATLGVAGTLAYITSRREREIGVRMALGATARQIVSLVLSRGLMLVAFGVLAGAVASLFLTRLLQSMLFGVTPADPLSFAAVAATLFAAGIAASAIPAARAARTDPMNVMRAE
ncbi:MAG TPA: ABC transporter permease [Thermoanaerobaculia bacterium]|nr:ABC transporter permease [Thermoanaerobaculia bacterium]